jgi:urea carboxylase
VTKDFTSGKPWLLRFFDRLRFYPVSADELLKLRSDFAAGRHELRIEEGEFSLADYNRFCGREADSIKSFKNRQETAFLAERQRWLESGQLNFESQSPEGKPALAAEIPPGTQLIESQVPGSVWKVEKQAGDQVRAGEVIVILESMKMEIATVAPTDGHIVEVRCAEGRAVAAGDALVVFRPES